MDYLKRELEPTPADRRARRLGVWAAALALTAFYAWCIHLAYV